MEQLGGELAWEAGPAGLGEPVRTGLDQPCGRLLVGEAAGVHAQLSQHVLGCERASRGSDTSPRIAAGTSGPAARHPRCPLRRPVVAVVVVVVVVVVFMARP